MHRTKLAITLLVVLAHPAAAVAQSDITLRRAATIPTGTPVTLADIADLRGPDTEPLRSLAVDDTRSPGHIDLDEVRSALQARGVSWSRLILRGTSCRINAPADPPDQQPEPTAANSVVVTAPFVPAPGTVGALIAPALARQLNITETDLRVEFDPADAALLAQPVGARTLDIHPLGRANRTQCRVTIYDGDRLAASELVRVGVQVRHVAPVLKNPVKRGAPIAAEDFAPQECWLGPAILAADPARVAGGIARTNLAAGEPILTTHVESPVAVERGQIVSVHCVSGSILVRMSGRALADARDGEEVDIEHLDSTRKDPRRFRGRVSGPGLVVVGAAPARTSAL